MRYNITITNNSGRMIVQDNADNINFSALAELETAKGLILDFLKMSFFRIKNNYKSTITFDGNVFDLSRDSVDNVEFKIAEMDSIGATYENWKTADDNITQLSKQNLVDLLSAMKASLSQKGTTLYGQKWANEAAVNACSNVFQFESLNLFYEVG